MNQKNVMGAALVFVGVALVYAAATGNLQSAWNGLKGDCGAAGGSGSGTTTASNADVTQPTRGVSGLVRQGGSGGDYYYVGSNGLPWAGNAGAI